ncbi:MAG: cystathionine gamma-synthase [Candidatus Dormibacteria bacterium]
MTPPDPRWRFATTALHVGQGPDLATGAVVQPIHMATTFAQDGVGGLRAGFEYGRTGNPTRNALEECLAALEGGRHALSFASGLAATTTLCLLLSPGDHILYMDDIYGGTFRLFNGVLSRYGLQFSSVDASNLDAVAAAMTPQTRLLWAETPTNPLLRIADIAALAGIAHAGGARLCVDNTFATPYLQRPLELGADLVLHSATKYIGGHSDVVGGAVILSDDTFAEQLRFHQNAVGAVPSPFDCWLLLRGIKTLALRVDEQCRSALRIATWLESHPHVNAVHYPGLVSHPGHELSARQMSGRHGGMLSFEVADEAAARHVLGSLRVFGLAESLGAVESLAESPPLMTHASIPGEERRRIGLNDGLVRLSVGVEHVEDLIADLDQALD